MGIIDNVYGDNLLYVFDDDQCLPLGEKNHFLAIVKNGTPIQQQIPGVKVMHFEEDFESLLKFKLHPKTRFQDHMLSLRECEELIDRIPIGSLSMIIDGMPYVVGMNHFRIGKRIFFHCHPNGYKNHALGTRAMYFITEDFGPAMQSGTHSYNSVAMIGTMKIVDDYDTKLAVLKGMCEKLTPVHAWNTEMPNRPLMFELAVDFMQGKEHIYP